VDGGYKKLSLVVIMKDLSIIIPAYGLDDAIGLWATIESSIFDLNQTGAGLSYDFRICVNGNVRQSEELRYIETYLRKSGLVGEWLQVPEPMSCITARQRLTAKCDSKYLFFFDNHCLPKPGYFARGVNTMEAHHVDLLHSVTHMFAGFREDFEYKLTLEKNFWANEGYETPLRNSPYPIAAAGHGGIALLNSTWKSTGGYWDGFGGYAAGAEMYIDLKYWMLGKQVWIDPKFVHAHWAANRKYPRRSSAGYFSAMLMSANIIGGEKWVRRVYENIKNSDIIPMPVTTNVEADDIIDIENFVEDFESKSVQLTRVNEKVLADALEKSKDHALWMRRNRKLTLEELLDYFKQAGIRT
jgi:hypothetical protein